MTTAQDPAAARRQLLKELRRYRGEAGLTQKDVAAEMDWSASKVIRIESGSVSVSTNDLKALLALYRVNDADVVAGMVRMAKDSRRQSFLEYRDIIAPAGIQYYRYEASAWIIRQYEPLLVPGLLQTEEYTRAVLRSNDLKDDALERRVQARAERQELLDRAQPPQLHFIIDEAVIRRPVGGPLVMTEQLRHLQELAQRPGITIQVVPFSYGEYPGVNGPFVLLEFPGTEGDTVLYLENRADHVTRDDPEEIGRYLDIFLEMEQNQARPPGDIHAILANAITEMGRVRPGTDAEPA